MSTRTQNQAVRAYRKRLGDKGLRRYEVLGLPEDQVLIRSLAKMLASNDAEAVRLRSELSGRLSGPAPRKGGVLAGLRGSPLVGVELDLTREITPGRDVDL